MLPTKPLCLRKTDEKNLRGILREKFKNKLVENEEPVEATI